MDNEPIIICYDAKPFTKQRVADADVLPTIKETQMYPFDKEPPVPYLPVIGLFLHHLTYLPWVNHPWQFDGLVMKKLKDLNPQGYEAITSKFQEFQICAKENMALPKEGYNFLALQEVSFTYSKEQRELVRQLFNQYHFWNIDFPNYHESILEVKEQFYQGKRSFEDIKILLTQINEAYILPEDDVLETLLKKECRLEEIKDVLCNYSRNFADLDDAQYKAIASYEYYMQNINRDSYLKKLPETDQVNLTALKDTSFSDIRAAWQAYFPELQNLSDLSFLSFLKGESCNELDLMGACSSRVDLIRISWDPTIDKKIAQFLPVLEDVIKGNVRGRTPLNDLNRLAEQKVLIAEEKCNWINGEKIIETEYQALTKLEVMEQFWRILLGDPELVDKIFVEIYEMKMKTTFHVDGNGNPLPVEKEQSLERSKNRRFIRDAHKEMAGTIRPILRHLLVTLPKDMRNFETFTVLFERLEKTILAFSVMGEFRIAPSHIRFPSASHLSEPTYIAIKREPLHWFNYQQITEEWAAQTSKMQLEDAQEDSINELGINELLRVYPKDLIIAYHKEMTQKH